MIRCKRAVLRLCVLALVASSLAVGAFVAPASADDFTVEDTLTIPTADTSIEDNSRMRWDWESGPGEILFFRLSITRNWNGNPGFQVDSEAFGTEICEEIFGDPFDDDCLIPFFDTQRLPTIPEAVNDFVDIYNTFLADNERGEQLSTSQSNGMMTISYLVPRTDGTITVATEFSGTAALLDPQIDGTTVEGVLDLGTGVTTSPVVVAAGSRTAGLVAGPGADLADYTTTYSCIEDTNPASPIEGSGVVTASIAVAIGDDWTCTFTNVEIPPVLCGGFEVTVDMSKGETPTDGDDVIRGTSGPDIINALGGNDVVCSLQGDDTINGGDGFDQIFGGDGADAMIGGAGNDKLVGGAGNDEILGGAGNDRIQGGPGADVLHGENGLDRIAGGTGNDILRGGKFADELLGGLGRDQLFGEEGDDLLKGGAWIDTMDGGPQNDGCTLTDPSGIIETRLNCEAGVFGR